MLIDQTQRKWAWISLIIFALATASYVIYAETAANGPHGGSVMGLIYGIIGTGFMVFAGFLAARKRVPHWRLGSAQFWLRGHIWLGTLSMPLILYHAGFGWGGLLENALWVLFGLVYLSGFFGLAVQQVLPRILTTRIPLETFGAQVPYQCRRMQFIADRIVSKSCGKLNIKDEPIYATFKNIAVFGKSATKEDIGNWPDQAPEELRGLFLDLATYSKQQRWIAQENKFPEMLAEVYVDLLPEEAPKPAAKGTEEKKASPLDQMKAKKDAAPAGDGEKKLSPLEQMKAKKKAAAPEGEGEKKLSPLEQMKAKAAAKKAAPGTDGEPEKKLSPLEQMKAKAAAKKKAAEADGEEAAAEPAKKLSPLEQMKAKAAAKKKAAETGGEETPAEPAKKLAPLEQMKAKTAAKKKAAETAGGNGARESLDSVTAGLLPEEQGKTINITEEQAEMLAAASERKQLMAQQMENQPEGPIVIPCPDCGYELKLPNKSLLGHKARCPLCSNKFTLELPEEPEPVAVAVAVASKSEASPIKQAMLQDAGGAKPSAKPSPLDALKKQAATKAAEAKPADKALSPVEKMRAAKAKTTAAATETPAADKKPKKKATLKVAKKKQKTFTGPIPRAGELRDFYVRQIRPYLDVNSQSTPQLGVDAQSKRLFSQMRSDLPGELHDTLNQLEDFVDERRQFTLQSGIHHWLHWWLFLHIPLSMGLYILMIAHIIMALIVNPQLLWG